MRYTTLSMILIAATTVAALPAGVIQRGTNNLKDHGPEFCGNGDGDCKYIEHQDIYHAGDDVASHFGNQAENVTHGTGKAMADGGAPHAMGQADANAGDKAADMLSKVGRRDSISPTFVKKTFEDKAMTGGDAVGAEAHNAGHSIDGATAVGPKPAQDMGATADAMGSEANNAFHTWGQGPKNHDSNTNNAIKDEIAKTDSKIMA